MTNHQRGIQTVELAGEILKLVCDSKKSLSLSEIADTLKLAPGSTYKYLISLLRTGLLKRNESTLEYEAGPLSLRLGLSKINHDVILAQAREALTQLAEKNKLNAFASIWSDLNGPTVVFYKEYGGFFNIGFHLGMNLSLINTTTGRLFAAYMAEDVLKANNPAFNQDPVFETEVIHIRAVGYSTLTNIPTPGFTSYAVPVFDRLDKLIMTLTVFGQSDYFDRNKEKIIVDELKQLAQRLEG